MEARGELEADMKAESHHGIHANAAAMSNQKRLRYYSQPRLAPTMF